MSRFMISNIGQKVEYGSPEWDAYQSGAYTVAGTKASSKFDELKQLLATLLEQQRETKAQELRFVEYELEAEAYRERKRKRLIADVERILQQ